MHNDESLQCPKCSTSDVSDCTSGECDRRNGPIVNHCHGCGHTWPLRTLRNLVDERATPETVERYWREGKISDKVFADYRQLWRLAAPRLSDVYEADGARPITQAVYDELVRIAQKEGYEP